MKSYLIIIVFMFSWNCVFSQEPNFKLTGYSSLQEYVGDLILKKRKDYISMQNLDSLCITGCSFVSFKIDSSGSILSINFDNNTPIQIRKVLQGFIKETNGKWVVQNKKNQDEFLLMIPFIYNFFTKSCPPMDRSYASLLSLMSTFGNSTKGSFDGIEKREGQHVFLMSPVLFSSSFY